MCAITVNIFQANNMVGVLLKTYSIFFKLEFVLDGECVC